MKTKSEKTGLTRSMNFDLIVKDLDLKKKIINSIRLYRAVCRQVYSLTAMAKISGAEIVNKNNEFKVVEDKNTDIGFMTEVLGRNPHRQINIQSLCPTVHGFFWDSIRDDVYSRWKAKDPEFNVQRGWLTLQGSRDIAWFNHIGIGMPFLTARPKLHEHTISVKWDHEIGVVDFMLGKLDGSRYGIWKSLRDNVSGWKLGTIYLNERDNDLRMTVSYSMPEKEVKIDKRRECELEFTDDPDNFIVMKRCDKKMGGADKISAIEAIDWLKKINILRDKFDKRKQAVGNPNRAWGSKKLRDNAQKCLDRITHKKEEGKKYRNHLWTRRIVNFCERNGIGTIRLMNSVDTLFGEDWAWYQFKFALQYKIEEIGGRILIKCASCGDTIELKKPSDKLCSKCKPKGRKNNS